MMSLPIDDTSLPGYRAVLEGAGLIDLSGRGKIAVSGPDRVSFLHAMVSNDVEGLEAGRGCYATFLTSTGKLVADFYCYKLEEFVLVDLDADLAETFKESLGKFIIMDDVTLSEATGQWGHLSLQGPLSGRVAASVLGVEAPAEALRMTPARFDGADGWLIRKDALSESGCEILLPATAAARLKARLLERPEVAEVGQSARETLRVERGLARFGVDMDHRNNPLEVRLNHAISFTKGCYIGQEVVAKATYIGGVGRLLCRLVLEGDTVPEPGAAVIDESGKPVGAVTSAVHSPRLGRPIVLALVRRASADEGTRLRVRTSEGVHAAGRVVAEFLPQ